MADQVARARLSMAAVYIMKLNAEYTHLFNTVSIELLQNCIRDEGLLSCLVSQRAFISYKKSFLSYLKGQETDLDIYWDIFLFDDEWTKRFSHNLPSYKFGCHYEIRKTSYSFGTIQLYSEEKIPCLKTECETDNKPLLRIWNLQRHQRYHYDLDSFIECITGMYLGSTNVVKFVHSLNRFVLYDCSANAIVFKNSKGCNIINCFENVHERILFHKLFNRVLFYNEGPQRTPHFNLTPSPLYDLCVYTLLSCEKQFICRKTLFFKNHTT